MVKIAQQTTLFSEDGVKIQLSFRQFSVFGWCSHVLFNNRTCVAVPLGIVDKMLEHIDPMLQYDRKGGLYVAEMQPAGFGWQGAKEQGAVSQNPPLSSTRVFLDSGL